jgi:hypothetical protein
MSFPQIFEVVLGLILVYYILGAIVSTITQILNESLETRGAALEKYLLQIAGERTIDLTNLPQIKALRPIRYASWWNVFGAGTEEKKVEKIPASTLVNAFFDLSGLTCKASVSADELTSLLNTLPESEGKQAMLRWVQQGVTDLNELRSRTSDYFTGLLNQAASTFKARARSIVIILSLLITLALGTDTIQLAKDLWADSGLRDLAAQQARAVAAQPQGDATQLTGLVGNLSTYSIRLGWWQPQNLPKQTSLVNWLVFVALKLAGLGITAVAVSQGSSFWYDILKKITGQSSSSGNPAGGDAAAG